MAALSKADAEALAERVLSAVLAEQGFDRAEVEPRANHAGEDALFVTLRFKPNAPAMSGERATDALLAFIHALEAAGDGRFPYFSYAYPDDVPPAAGVMDAAE